MSLSLKCGVIEDGRAGFCTARTAPSHATAPAAAAPAANSSAAPAAKTLASADGGGLFDPPKAKVAYCAVNTE